MPHDHHQDLSKSNEPKPAKVFLMGFSYGSATHSFCMQFDQNLEFAGHKLAYDPAAAKDAADRTAAVMEAHLK